MRAGVRDGGLPEDGPIGLEELERRVHAAASRLAALAGENARLAARVAELESAAERSATEPASAPPSAASVTPGDPAAAEWRRERAEVRRRVEKLARRLADLLGEES